MFYSKLSFAIGIGIYHKVKAGDQISDIVEREFPEEYIYGKVGMLKKILSLNPKIKNLNHIYPGQVIILSDENRTDLKEVNANTNTEKKSDCIARINNTVIVGPKPAEVTNIDPAPILAPTPAPTPAAPLIYPIPITTKDENSEMGMSILLGSKYVSITQTGAIGKAKLGMLYFDNLIIKSDFNYQEWTNWVQFSSYKFQYNSPAGHDQKNMSAFDLGAAYHIFSASLGTEQTPLFKNSSGVVQMSSENLFYLSLGLKKEFVLLSKKLTIFKLSASIRVPVSSVTDNSQVEINSVSGFGVKAQAELNRQLFSNNNYSLYINWISNISQQSITQDVTWNTSSGNVKSVNADSSTSLGLLLKF